MNHPDFFAGQIPKQKVTGYLLNLEHPEGGSKAKFFLSRGFTAENWPRLIEALLNQAGSGKVSAVKEGRFGTKFIVDGQIACLDRSLVRIRTVWIVRHGTKIPSLVTAHPL